MSALVYPFTDTPVPGMSMQVVPGVYWLRLPLPFTLDHINVWLLDNGDSWTLIDTGPATRVTREAWETLFKQYLPEKPIANLIITHFHPDHFGLAKWHYEQRSLDVKTTLPTYKHAEYLLYTELSKVENDLTAFYELLGVPDPAKLIYFITGQSYRQIVSGIPDKISFINDNDEILIGRYSWRAIISNGHAEGHLSLYCKELGLLISGDQVLPGITSNVSLYTDIPEANPLLEYLESFTNFLKLPQSTTVLPSHGRIFQGLHDRIQYIETDHKEKLTQIYSFCEQPRTVSDTLAFLFRPELDDLNWMLAFGESFAHLRYLEKQGRLKCSDINGVLSFHHP